MKNPSGAGDLVAWAVGFSTGAVYDASGGRASYWARPAVVAERDLGRKART
jgi:hypothetical protein